MMAERRRTKKEQETSQRRTFQEKFPTDSKNPAWRFERVDRSKPFAFDPHRSDFDAILVIDKILSYSSLTWEEIKQQTHDDGKSKNHTLDYHGLSKAAKERIQKLELSVEDQDSIFSFAFTNKIRIVGIKDGADFFVLWYDPKHEVYPVRK